MLRSAHSKSRKLQPNSNMRKWQLFFIVCLIATNLLADEKIVAAIKAYQKRHPDAVSNLDGIVPPKLLSRIEPEFPREAKKKNRLLTPIFAAMVVDKKGNTLDPEIVRSDNSDLDAYVIKALKQWKYEPASKDGKAVEYLIIITVHLDT